MMILLRIESIYFTAHSFRIMTTLLHGLLAQTLPDTTSSISKTHIFIKMPLNCQPMMQYSLFYDLKHHLNPFGLDKTVKPEKEDARINQLMNYNRVLEQPLALSICPHLLITVRTKYIKTNFSQPLPALNSNSMSKLWWQKYQHLRNNYIFYFRDSRSPYNFPHGKLLKCPLKPI